MITFDNIERIQKEAREIGRYVDIESELVFIHISLNNLCSGMELELCIIDARETIYKNLL